MFKQSPKRQNLPYGCENIETAKILQFNKFDKHRKFFKMKNCIVKMVVKNKSRQNPQQLSNSEVPNQLSSSQGFIKSSRTTEDRQSISFQLKNLMESFEKILKETTKPSKSYQIEPRNRKIVYDLPSIPIGQKLQKRELQFWITKLCNQVFSAAFHYFQRGNMNYDQAKIYCSQNIITNIVQLNERYNLSSQQIRFIDDHIENGIAPYLLSKYPMTQTQIINKALESQIKEIDNIQALENDVFFYSDDSYGFQYRENGNYNDKIMEFMNDLMTKIDQKEVQKGDKTLTFYEQFYDYIQKKFELVQSRDWMENGQFPSSKNAKQDLNKKVQDQKYRSRVKGYTSWVIGRKISENVAQYSGLEIISKHMVIKSPAILRILTKWCQQLWNKFQKKNYFIDRTQNVKCQKGRNVNTYFAWMRTIINDHVEEQKMQIQRYMERLIDNNYDQQSIHLFRSLKGNFITYVQKYEKSAGIFTVNVVNNLHSYILLYLNRLIHGLLKVSKRVYDKELIGRARWNSPPNLISFKIGDLMRCKIGSEEKEILKLYQNMNQTSMKQPCVFKIIRIKNRLREGTNDILMNIKFKNVFLCEVQLAINSDHSNFIKCSNKYNHFIYEVKRSIFGPISELCSIWKSLDGRCKIYQKIASNKKQLVSLASLKKSSCEELSKKHSLQAYNQPFVCSKCSQTYSHSNFIWPHQRCESCQAFTLCCNCRVDDESEVSLKQKLFKNQEQISKYSQRIEQNQDIPKYGVCVGIQSKHINLQKFVKLNIKGKVSLFYRKFNGQIDLITDLNTKKQIEAFRQNYIIFKFPVAKGQQLVNISPEDAKNSFLLPKLVKNIYKKEKQFISLIGQDIKSQQLATILVGKLNNRLNIRTLQLPDNKISDIQFISKNFPNLSKLVLSRNQIKDISELHKLTALQKLNIRDNEVSELPAQIFNLYKLQDLNIRNNKFRQIPQQISNLSDLQKLEANDLKLTKLPQSLSKMTKITYLDFSKNDLAVVPAVLKTLKNLQHLGLSSNGIQQIPDWIGAFKCLRVFQLNKNSLTSIPTQFEQLESLVTLELNNNKLTELNFSCPKSVNVLLLNGNKISKISENFFVNCDNLVKVQLDKNQLTTLPINMGVICKNLRNLSLKNNKLSSLPKMLGVFLPSLQLIQLNNNKLASFPRVMNRCKQLVEIHFSNNPLEDTIPHQFLDNNFKIQRLDFSETKLTTIPTIIQHTLSLKKINFSKTIIPAQKLWPIGKLKFLQELKLSDMGLKELPDTFKQLHFLREVDLSNNQIQTLDEDFLGKWTHLRLLNLDNNKLKQIPSSLKSCRRIKTITAVGNKINHFPQEIFQFAKIQQIILDDNEIQQIQTKVPLPSTVVTLSLKNNKIKSISPIFLKNAQSLKKFYLTNNKLTRNPQRLKDCSQFLETQLSDNPIVMDEKEIIRQTIIDFAQHCQIQDEEEEAQEITESVADGFT